MQDVLVMARDPNFFVPVSMSSRWREFAYAAEAWILDVAAIPADCSFQLGEMARVRRQKKGKEYWLEPNVGEYGRDRHVVRVLRAGLPGIQVLAFGRPGWRRYNKLYCMKNEVPFWLSVLALEVVWYSNALGNSYAVMQQLERPVFYSERDLDPLQGHCFGFWCAEIATDRITPRVAEHLKQTTQWLDKPNVLAPMPGSLAAGTDAVHAGQSVMILGTRSVAGETFYQLYYYSVAGKKQFSTWLGRRDTISLLMDRVLLGET